MKAIAALLLSISFATIAQAADLAKVFNESQVVVDEIAKLNAMGFTEKGEVTTLMLSGSCGFAGCDREYLVGMPLETVGSNTQTASVTALITFSPIGKVTTVKLAEIN